MTKTEEIRSKAKLVAKRIEKFDIPVAGYQRGPNGNELFTISIDRAKQVRVWPGIAEVQVRGDSRHQQAVLRVAEKDRKVTQRVEVFTTFEINSGGGVVATNGIRAHARGNFSIVFPDPSRVTWTYGDMEPDRYGKELRSPGTHYGRLFVPVTAHVAASEQSLLIGYDETDLFISMLPKPVDTVKEAHDLLRPSKVDPGTPRQGEWFFKPVTERMAEILDRHLMANPAALDRVTAIGNTSHFAAQTRFKNKLYTAGVVTDRRQGRTHHDPLFLHGWHEIVRNREVALPTTATPQRRSWD